MRKNMSFADITTALHRLQLKAKTTGLLPHERAELERLEYNRYQFFTRLDHRIAATEAKLSMLRRLQAGGTAA